MIIKCRLHALAFTVGYEDMFIAENWGHPGVAVTPT